MHVAASRRLSGLKGGKTTVGVWYEPFTRRVATCSRKVVLVESPGVPESSYPITPLSVTLDLKTQVFLQMGEVSYTQKVIFRKKKEKKMEKKK